MRRESVASLRVRHLASDWGLRGVYTKGGKTRDIPLPSVIMKFLQTYVERALVSEVGSVTGDTRCSGPDGRDGTGSVGRDRSTARTSGVSAKPTAG